MIVPAYGLTDSGRVWYWTMFEARAKRCRFVRLTLGPSTHLHTNGEIIRSLVVQIDDNLDAEPFNAGSSFKVTFCGQPHICSSKMDLILTETSLFRDSTGKLAIKAMGKFD